MRCKKRPPSVSNKLGTRNGPWTHVLTFERTELHFIVMDGTAAIRASQGLAVRSNGAMQLTQATPAKSFHTSDASEPSSSYAQNGTRSCVMPFDCVATLVARVAALNVSDKLGRDDMCSTSTRRSSLDAIIVSIPSNSSRPLVKAV